MNGDDDTYKRLNRKQKEFRYSIRIHHHLLALYCGNLDVT